MKFTPEEIKRLRELWEVINSKCWGMYLGSNEIDLFKKTPELLDEIERLQSENERLKEIIGSEKELNVVGIGALADLEYLKRIGICSD